MKYDCIIIGGGASGLMLAANLELEGRSGLILEKTQSAGTKLLMSGGGRCNITHGGSIKDFISAYGDAGPKLRKCLYRHSNLELMSWLEDHGIALSDGSGSRITSGMAEDCGRVFPASMRASDVLDLLLSCARENGWELMTGSEVSEIRKSDDGSAWEISASGTEAYTAASVVIASGGITFPETGSDGSMSEIIRGLGVEVTPLHSALAPVYVEDYPYEELSGISLDDVTVTAFGSDIMNTCKGKAARMSGSLLFTHRGFSGPVILNISRHAEPGERIRIQYNREFSDLPKRLQKVLESRSRGPSGDVRSTVLAGFLDHDDFTVSAVDENGMVTAGGISLDELDMRTMKIRALSADGTLSMYAVGEAIDADGITGGYNLQMCWSTALTAADSLKDGFNE